MYKPVGKYQFTMACIRALVMIACQAINCLISQPNICRGYSKEPSQWDGSFKHQIIGWIWWLKNIYNFKLKNGVYLDYDLYICIYDTPYTTGICQKLWTTYLFRGSYEIFNLNFMQTHHFRRKFYAPNIIFPFIIYLQKYQLILPIFLHKNTKSCITLLAFSDSVSPSSIVYPRRTTFTLVLYLGKTWQRADIWIKYYCDVVFFHGFFFF